MEELDTLNDIDQARNNVYQAWENLQILQSGPTTDTIMRAELDADQATLALELGTYCGYGALRIARAAPRARVVSVELADANAANARRIWAHAGVADRITCVVGTIGDGGRTLDALARDHGLAPGALDFLFIDHDKAAYLPDLGHILDRGWLHRGSIVVADNILIPGAPKYRAHLRAQQGTTWNTVEHRTHAEYTAVPDMVLESEYLG